jgi:uncharacterized membrane protein
MRKLGAVVLLLFLWQQAAVADVGGKAYSDSNVSISFDGNASTPIGGVNTVEGVIIVGRNGSVAFEGRLVRRSINVSFDSLNYARETDLKMAQSVYERLDETVVRREGDRYRFSLYIREFLDVFDMEIRFPGDVDIREISSSIPYLRKGNTLFFNKTDNQYKTEIDVLYSEMEEKPATTLIMAAEPGSAINPFIYLIVLVALLILLVFVYYMRRNGPEQKKALKGDILETLNDKERGVLNLLLEAGGRETQARLRQKSGMPKSSLSNLLRDMEQKKLVRRYDSWLTKDVEIDGRVYKK